MSKSKSKISILIISVIILLGLTACTGKTVDTTISVTLTNSSKAQVKMWLGHDKTPPANASIVEPGSSAVWSATVKTVLNDDESVKEYDDSIRANASDKDGKLLSQDLVDITGSNGPLNIAWDGKSFILK